MNIFSALDPSVKKLLGWKLGDEEEKWAFKAVESLVKKLRKKKSGVGTVEDLEFALAHPGVCSKCVTIPRSLDGRLQPSSSSSLHGPPSNSMGNANFFSSSSPSPYNMGMLPPNGQKLSNAATPVSPNYSVGNQHDMMETQFSSPYSNATLQSPMQSNSVASPSVLSDDDDFLLQCQGAVTENCPLGQIENWAEPDYWCTICYYELNSRVGEPWRLPSVVVDGFTDPSQEDDRICLGLLSNVNRNITIENTRRHIGKGVRFVCTDSLVTIYNLSQSPIFVQSRNSNFKYNLQATSVYRVPAGSSLIIFDYQLFHNMLEKAKSEGYHHVYELQKMCFIRLSFVKGWGADYHRQDVTSTPCWLEIQLHQPLSWIDSVITPMDPPEHLNITSVS
ncbi:Mothers against decapentaplegic-like protein [Aphelenchoides fujianensis]|nr:Mothers against decapentaplegic-like protein [Aphelenchoides fujianensis]